MSTKMREPDANLEAREAPTGAAADQAVPPKPLEVGEPAEEPIAEPVVAEDPPKEAEAELFRPPEEEEQAVEAEEELVEVTEARTFKEIFPHAPLPVLQASSRV